MTASALIGFITRRKERVDARPALRLQNRSSSSSATRQYGFVKKTVVVLSENFLTRIDEL